MKKLLENWRDYEKKILKEGQEEAEEELPEGYDWPDFLFDLMTVSWEEEKMNPETGKKEKYINFAMAPGFSPGDDAEEEETLKEDMDGLSPRERHIEMLKSSTPREASVKFSPGSFELEEKGSISADLDLQEELRYTDNAGRPLETPREYGRPLGALEKVHQFFGGDYSSQANS